MRCCLRKRSVFNGLTSFLALGFFALLFLLLGGGLFVAGLGIVDGGQVFGELGLGVCVLRIFGEVGPFVGIGRFVIEFFIADSSNN